MPDVPSPQDHGWLVNEDGTEISVAWMDSRPAPEKLSVLTKCTCQGGCTSSRCSCKKEALLCTDACTCKNYQNSLAQPEDDSTQVTDGGRADQDAAADEAEDLHAEVVTDSEDDSLSEPDDAIDDDM